MRTECSMKWTGLGASVPMERTYSPGRPSDFFPHATFYPQPWHLGYVSPSSPTPHTRQPLRTVKSRPRVHRISDARSRRSTPSKSVAMRPALHARSPMGSGGFAASRRRGRLARPVHARARASGLSPPPSPAGNMSARRGNQVKGTALSPKGMCLSEATPHEPLSARGS